MKRKAFIEFAGSGVVYINTLYISSIRFELRPEHNEHYIDLITLKISENKIHIIEDSTPPFIAYISYNEESDSYSLAVMLRNKVDGMKRFPPIIKGAHLFEANIVEK